MKIYRYYAEVTVSAYTVVEADTEEQALAIVEGRSAKLMTGYSSNGEEKDYWVVEAADGDPKKIVLDSIEGDDAIDD